MISDQRYIGIDIGGTSVKLGVVDDEGTVLLNRTVPLDISHGREATLQTLYRDVERLAEDAGCGMEGIAAIGVAAPGTLDLQNGIIMHPFNLPGFENLPLRFLIAERFGRPTALQNDANAAAFGEYWVGAARGADSLMFWTLGTGVGGGIVLDGRILEGAHSHAAECGHTIIQMEGGPRSEFGIHGSVELHAGGKALVRRCLEALDAGRPSLLASQREAGVAITPLEIAQAADRGDELALELVLDTARFLGIGTVNIMHIVNPDMILVGGAMTFGGHDTDLGRRFLDRLREEVRRWAFPIPAQRTRIDFALLGNDAGFIGAAGCARTLLHRQRG